MTPLVVEALQDTPVVLLLGARQAGMSTLVGSEVDLLLERADGRVVGLDVKASAAAQARDFRGLKHLAETLGKGFHRGVVFYTGTEVLPFGPRLWAVPVSALWLGLAT